MIELKENADPKPVVVRLSTECCEDDQGVNFTRRVRWIRQESHVATLLSTLYDVRGSGADLFIERIVNLNHTPDGVYVLVPVNISRDRKTRVVDDWDYELLPFNDCENETTKEMKENDSQ